MHLKTFVMLFSLICVVCGKNAVKTLTESNGQEVIEIGTPIKELPVGLEEEPGGENDDDDDNETTTLKNSAKTQVLATKKEYKKTTAASVKKEEIKETETSKEITPDEDEERIEKELAEIYKDTADYKTDSLEEKELVKEPLTTTTVETTTYETEVTVTDDYDKPIGRQRNNFKFQPDSTDVASIEKFRTSIDEISCNNREKLKGTIAPVPDHPSKPDNAFRIISNGILLITVVLSYVFICT
ncbi:hypothetical protein PYW08_012357 [Mythimna loreyi]|uniref:Uncharacterized protein n=1 Tax=Mythimna loreyi TaxID=667449 RepID=A0ACC2Q181_9NEOP|nr:hypothetical protein PYW08_012357 [Mythimna loreyi]